MFCFKLQWLNGIVRLHEDFARYLNRLKSDDDSVVAAASAAISSASESTSASPASTISASSNSSATLTTSSVDSELFSKPFTLSVPPNKDSVNNFESPTSIVRLDHDRCSVTKVNSLASSSLDSVNPLQGEHALNGDRMSNGSVNGVGGAEFHGAHQTGSSLVSQPTSVDSRITASPLVSESGLDSFPNPHLSFRHGFLGSGELWLL